MLGRIHGPGEIGAAVAELAAAGLDNFNLDLMYALPHQTREARSPTSRPRSRSAPRTSRATS